MNFEKMIIGVPYSQNKIKGMGVLLFDKTTHFVFASISGFDSRLNLT
jgi:hypothetical protein